MRKWILILAICSMIVGIAAADDGNETDADTTIPAVSFDKIIDYVYGLLSGWFKQIVILMVLVGGIYYMFGGSEEARAAGASRIKRPVETVIAVMVIIWFINQLFTL